jgi:hypothetical protein
VASAFVLNDISAALTFSVKLLPNALPILRTFPFSYSKLEDRHIHALEALLIQIG